MPVELMATSAMMPTGTGEAEGQAEPTSEQEQRLSSAPPAPPGNGMDDLAPAALRTLRVAPQEAEEGVPPPAPVSAQNDLVHGTPKPSGAGREKMAELEPAPQPEGKHVSWSHQETVAAQNSPREASLAGEPALHSSSPSLLSSSPPPPQLSTMGPSAELTPTPTPFTNVASWPRSRTSADGATLARMSSSDESERERVTWVLSCARVLLLWVAEAAPAPAWIVGELPEGLLLLVGVVALLSLYKFPKLRCTSECCDLATGCCKQNLGLEKDKSARRWRQRLKTHRQAIRDRFKEWGLSLLAYLILRFLYFNCSTVGTTILALLNVGDYGRSRDQVMETVSGKAASLWSGFYSEVVWKSFMRYGVSAVLVSKASQIWQFLVATERGLFGMRVNISLNLRKEKADGTYRFEMRTVDECSCDEFLPRLDNILAEAKDTAELEQMNQAHHENSFRRLRGRFIRVPRRQAKQINDQIVNRLSKLFGKTYLQDDMKQDVQQKTYIYAMTYEYDEHQPDKEFGHELVQKFRLLLMEQERFMELTSVAEGDEMLDDGRHLELPPCGRNNGCYGSDRIRDLVVMRQLLKQEHLLVRKHENREVKYALEKFDFARWKRRGAKSGGPEGGTWRFYKDDLVVIKDDVNKTVFTVIEDDRDDGKLVIRPLQAEQSSQPEPEPEPELAMLDRNVSTTNKSTLKWEACRYKCKYCVEFKSNARGVCRESGACECRSCFCTVVGHSQPEQPSQTGLGATTAERGVVHATQKELGERTTEKTDCEFAPGFDFQVVDDEAGHERSRIRNKQALQAWADDTIMVAGNLHIAVPHAHSDTNIAQAVHAGSP